MKPNKNVTPPAHEADRLAVEIEKDAALVKRFGYRGSFVILFVAVFLLIGISLYAALSAFTSRSLALQSQNADAAWLNTFGSGSGGSAPKTISGYKAPAPTATDPTPAVEAATKPGICPRGLVTVSPGTLTVGGPSATVSAPAGWKEGSFHSTNPSVIRVDGTTVTAVSAGYAQVYGIDFRAGTEWPCTADAVGVTAQGAPQIKPAFINGYEVISDCGRSSATLRATAGVPGEIRFTEIRNEGGTTASSYRGARTAKLTKLGDGSYSGQITVRTRDFGEGLAAIFRLYGATGEQLAPGYAAVSHDYDSSCQ